MAYFADCTLASEHICSVRFVCDHSRLFGTLATKHICSVQFVCHRSEKISSTCDAVCRSLYVTPFA